VRGGATSHRVQVAASEVVAAGVVRVVGERVALAELAFVPDQIDQVEAVADRLCRPATAPGSLDEPNAGIGAPHIVLQVVATARA
jgi:hypothetical protein